jgi:tRNA A37 N6-isopentenylltransferase MiaA
MLHEEDEPQAAASTTAADPDRLERLAELRQLLDQSRDRLAEIEGEMYAAELDENRGLMLRLRDERDELELRIDPLEAEIYDLEYRKPPRPAGTAH